MQALNERDCECGCGMGKIAGCIKKDPNCPRSPNLAQAAIDLVKQGKGLGEILARHRRQAEAVGRVAVAQRGAPPRAARRRSSRSRTTCVAAPKATKVTIVEFSDFQCPFCKRSEPTVKGVLDKYGKDVALVWMNQPLPFHDHAMDAATAFQAAARQDHDKAWKLHDKMYENNTALTRADIEKYAGEVGLNAGKFKKDWDDPKIKAEVDAGSEGRERGGRQRHADVLHQRPRAGRRAAGGRVREDHRRRDQEGRRAHQEGHAAQGRLQEADRGGGAGGAGGRAVGARGARGQAEHQAGRRAGEGAEPAPR